MCDKPPLCESEMIILCLIAPPLQTAANIAEVTDHFDVVLLAYA